MNPGGQKIALSEFYQFYFEKISTDQGNDWALIESRICFLIGVFTGKAYS